MAIYLNFIEYIRCSENTQEKIARINAIIEALEDAELSGASKAHLEEYQLDDGQDKVKVIYSDLKSIENTILALEKRKQRLINRCIGSRYGLQDGKVINC